MNSTMQTIFWLIFVYSSGTYYNRLVSCETHKNRSTQCDMTGDNCPKQKFSFERFQMNAIKVNTSTMKKSGDNIGAVDTGALANLINNQENGKLNNNYGY